MKTLILLRHAKSDWHSSASTDFERPLNDRGIADATKMGAWMRSRYKIELTLCSTATRTRETYDGLGLASKVTYLDEFYDAPMQTIIKHIQSTALDAHTIMLLAHNPGIGMAAHYLASEDRDDELFDRYPTAAFTAMNFDIDEWREIDFDSGNIVDFVTPKMIG